MKRLRRWLFNGLAALSLLLCVATVPMWIRSFTAASMMGYATPLSAFQSRLRWLYAADGKIWLGELTNNDRGGWFFKWTIQPFASVVCDHNFAGFGVMRWGGQPPVLEGIDVPYWFVFLATALPAIISSLLRINRSRTKVGFCAKCGYDLRATPDRCPECGAVTVKQQL
jgi:hypothetical protein